MKTSSIVRNMVLHSCYLVLCWETQGALNLSPLKSTEGYRRVGAQFGGGGLENQQ